MSKAEIQRALWPTRRKAPGPEAAVVRGVLDLLNATPGVVAWRQNTGAAKFSGLDGQQYFVRFGQKGQADVTGLCRGFRLEVECKALGEVLTPLQAAWLQFIQDAGGVAFWCDSLDMCVEKLQAEFRKRKWQ